MPYSINIFSWYGMFACALAGSFAVFGLLVVWRALAHSASRLTRAGLLCLVLLPFLLFIHAVLRFALNVPMADDFDAFLRYFTNPFPARLMNVAALHGEHRIATVRGTAELLCQLHGSVNFRWIECVGNTLYLAFFLLVLRHMHQRQVAIHWFIPTAWMFLSILLYENMLWAITAIQSNCVVLFAFLSIDFACKNKRAFFLGALLFGILGTYTSGAGMYIWPTLALLLIKMRFIDHLRIPPMRFVLLAGVALITIGLYFWNFHVPSANEKLAFAQEWTFVVKVAIYLTAFCGSAAHFFPAACMLGLLILSAAVYLLFQVRSIKDNLFFMFLLYLLGTALTASLFRVFSCELEQSVSFRYRINSLCIMLCIAMLFKDLQILRIFSRASFCSGLTFLCIGFNLVAYLLAYPQLIVRDHALRDGLKTWTSDLSGIRYHDKEDARKLLIKTQASGIYDPDTALR